MNKVLSVVFALLFLFCMAGCKQDPDSQLKKELVGTYESENSLVIITFNKDMTFTSHTTSQEEGDGYFVKDWQEYNRDGVYELAPNDQIIGPHIKITFWTNDGMKENTDYIKIHRTEAGDLYLSMDLMDMYKIS